MNTKYVYLFAFKGKYTLINDKVTISKYIACYIVSLMPSEIDRKLIMLDTQPVMSLPSDWVRFWKMKKGDVIPILYDSILVVIPPTHPNKKKIEERIREVLIK